MHTQSVPLRTHPKKTELYCTQVDTTGQILKESLNAEQVTFQRSYFLLEFGIMLQPGTTDDQSYSIIQNSAQADLRICHWC
jgi:hypothetical protein